MGTWPTPADAAQQYYEANLKSAVRLLKSIVRDRRSRGSGRPPGAPQAEWRAVVVLAVAALEAGLMDLALAAHHHRITKSVTSKAGTSAQLTTERRRLVDVLQLSAPNAHKIENFLLSHFGVRPAQIAVPAIAHFTTRSKQVALGGAGSGSRVPFNGDWRELSIRLDAIQYFRNAIAHADSRKLTTIPARALSLSPREQGSIWARQKNGMWSLQMPHAVTAVRTTVSVFNTVAEVLHSFAHLGRTGMPDLMKPDDVVPFN